MDRAAELTATYYLSHLFQFTSISYLKMSPLILDDKVRSAFVTEDKYVLVLMLRCLTFM